MKSITLRFQSPMRASGHLPGREKGAALLVALILLVLMSLLGVSALRSGSLEERMAGNTYDRSISFQAAESALREAESTIEAAGTKPTPDVGADCTNGICGTTSDGSEFWATAADDDWKDATLVSNGSVDITPQYLIEYLGGTFPCSPNNPASGTDPFTCKRYRVTARSNAGDDRASVVLQSIYATN